MNNVTFTVIRRTIRVDMQMNSIVLKMGEFIKDEAGIEGVDEVILDMEMSKFAKISTRISADGLDFPLASPADSVEQVQDKFRAFMDTDMVDTVDDMLAAVNRADTSPAAGDPKEPTG